MTDRGQESGFSLVALVATMAVTMILMTVGASTWEYVIRNEREEETIFRGIEITDAIRRFQKKSGNTFPATLDILVEKKFLRKHALKDPLSKSGKWKIIHQGDLIAPIGPGGTGPRKLGEERGERPDTPQPSPSPFFGLKGEKAGPIVGVATTRRGKSLRIFNGQQDYAAWMFTINQPRPVIGALPFPTRPGRPGGVPVPGRPGQKEGR